MYLPYTCNSICLMLLQQEQELTLQCRRLHPTPGSCSQEAKAAAKKAKVEKAAVRQQAAAAEAKPAGSSKKAKAKQEAEEKRVRCCPELQLQSREYCIGCFAVLCGQPMQALYKQPTGA